MQSADALLTTTNSDDLQKAIKIYRNVMESENRSTIPWVEPYFKLINLLAPDPLNQEEIVSILDGIVVNNHFVVWIKINALMKKAKLFEKSHHSPDIDKAIACWEKVLELLKPLTNAEDEIPKSVYGGACQRSIKKMNKKKETVDQYTTTA
jgi:hypothetical protein